MNMKPASILLVEDNDGDILLTQRALSKSKLSLNMAIVRDGEEALKYLRRSGEYANASRPDLVLLDLNLPKKDGREVLAEIKGDPDLKMIPVVILTTSKAEEDVFKTYNLHANCYITKPMDLTEFNRVVLTIEEFWFTIVKLPRA